MALSTRTAEFLPVILLVAVAGAQQVLVRTSHLTPWKGGGFGMFSTLDHGAFRGVTIVVNGPDRSETIGTPPSIEAIAARVAACPSDWLLRELAESVVAREQRHGNAVTDVRIAVWRTDFDPVTLNATERQLRAVTYDGRRLSETPRAMGHDQ
jgi:hypothetical protein